MAEPTAADLKDVPSTYKSSRALFDVLVGEDTAIPLIEASSAGDVSKLRTMLAQSPWDKIILETPHTIYSEDRPSNDSSDIRGVLAKPIRNINRVLLKAAENGNAEVVSTLLNFASQHGLAPSSVIDRLTIKTTVEAGHAAVFKALATADPGVATFDPGHETLPLEIAIQERHHELVAVLLELGAGQAKSRRTAGSYRSSLLSRAAPDPKMTELLLQHGQTIAGSGALHTAAERGALESMRLLIDHGADVNERLPASDLPVAKRSLKASWTPLHFAASSGQVEAMELLQRRGVDAGLEDENGKTPLQLLSEQQSG